jgi:hypothetical protein
MHVVVARIGRIQMHSLAGVGADGFGAEADYIPLLHQEFYDFHAWARRMLTGRIEILVIDRIHAFRPVRAHQDP